MNNIISLRQTATKIPIIIISKITRISIVTYISVFSLINNFLWKFFYTTFSNRMQ